MSDRPDPREVVKTFPRRKQIQYYLEYLGFRLLEAIILAIPRKTGYKIGRFGAKAAWIFDKRHRRMSLFNTAAAFLGEKSIAETRKLSRDNFLHLGETAIDLIRSAEITKENQYEYFSYAGETEMVKREVDLVRKNNSGAAAISAHLGSQEMLVGHVLEFGLGGKETIVTKRIKNPYIDHFVQTQREILGVKVLPHKKSVKEIIKRVTSGEIIVFLMDQRAEFQEGVKVRFFGRPVVAHKGVALLALSLNLTVAPIFAIRQPDGKYCLTYLDKLELPRTGDMNRDVKTLTQTFQNIIETMVRKYPEQWFWAHDRWKHGDEMPDE